MSKTTPRWARKKARGVSAEKQKLLMNVGIPALTGLMGATLGVLGSLGATALGADAQSQNSRDDFLRTQQQAVFLDVIRNTHSFEVAYGQAQQALASNRDADTSKIEATMNKYQDLLINRDGDELALLAPRKVLDAQSALEHAVADTFGIFSTDGLAPHVTQAEINGWNELRTLVQTRLFDFEDVARATLGAHE